MIRALRSMGYRLARPGVWGKPVGVSLLTVKISDDKALFECWIKGANDKNLLWDSEEVRLDEIDKKWGSALSWIKHVENWNSKTAHGIDADFEFLTAKEIAEEVLS